MRVSVVTRTTALKAIGEMPKRESPDTISASHGRQIECCGMSRRCQSCRSIVSIEHRFYRSRVKPYTHPMTHLPPDGAAMLYIPPAHREQDLATLHAHIAATGLATLVTVGDDGPLVSHLPLLLDPAAGRHGELTGHLARANPQWRASDLRKPALAIFKGPDAHG